MMEKDNERLIITRDYKQQDRRFVKERRTIGPHGTRSLASRGGDNAANRPAAFPLSVA
jgi:hypothetical protein